MENLLKFKQELENYVGDMLNAINENKELPTVTITINGVSADIVLDADLYESIEHEVNLQIKESEEK